MIPAPSETQHEEVYGKTFALYDRQALLDFIKPFLGRFEANGLDPRAIFAGKRCFDAGCGGGRGSIFMAQNGAASVEALDFSESNVASARRNGELFGFDVKSRKGTLASLPYETGTFDAVWCNGVLQHAAEPDRCLTEITRVLRVGGVAWIYVYGSGGVYWYTVERFRALFRELPTDRCVAGLRIIGCQTRYVAEYIDDWKVAFLRTYTRRDLTQRLTELGYANPEVLKFGVSYDTSQRVNTFPGDAVWLGQGDLRYLITKTDEPATDNHRISSSERGSDAPFAPEITSRFGPLFDRLEQALRGDILLSLAAAAYVQRKLRDQMSENVPFDPDRYEQSVQEAIGLVEVWKSVV